MKKTIAFRCPADLHEEIRLRADREKRSTSEIVCSLLAKSVAGNEWEAVDAQLQALEDNQSDLALNLSELAHALVRLGSQIRIGFEAALLNLAPEKDKDELRKWLDLRFPPVLDGVQE